MAVVRRGKHPKTGTLPQTLALMKDLIVKVWWPAYEFSASGNIASSIIWVPISMLERSKRSHEIGDVDEGRGGERLIPCSHEST